MKRSWPIYLMIGGLALLLVTLGVLQYRWLSQASAGDAAKERQRVTEQAHRFAQDFNREIQNAYFIFQSEPATWRDRDWSRFNERYKLWKERSQYPGLVSEIYFLDSNADAEPLMYVPDQGEFVTAELPQELGDVRANIVSEMRFTPVLEDAMTLLLPIHNADVDVGRTFLRLRTTKSEPYVKVAPQFGCLAIRLDPTVVREQLLTDLTSKYFGDGEYTTAIINSRRDPVINSFSSVPDAAAPLFDLSPDNLVFMASRELISTIENRSAEKVIIDSHLQTQNLKPLGDANEANATTKVTVKKTALPRTSSVYTATLRDGSPPPWTLLVQHSSGSVDAYAAATLRRNLAAGFGLLSLVALAIGAIIVSSFRARNFAQRQIDFVSSVSHEFRTPLSVIYSAGENLADGVARDSSQISRYGDLIKGEGRKLSAMVEQILEFAGADSGKRRFSFADTPVEEVINSAMEDCRQLIDQKNADVTVSIAPDLETISADRSALSQALQNLIANGLKYSNGQPRLRIAATNGRNVVRLTVEDNGIGIPHGDLKKIFEPFYRSKEVVDAQIHGNGLGLALVKQIVEAHGGSVSVESELGRGSVFTVDLPTN